MISNKADLLKKMKPNARNVVQKKTEKIKKTESKQKNVKKYFYFCFIKITKKKNSLEGS